MKVLIACEFSGITRRSFREYGHDTWSCDLLPSEDKSSHHYQGDVFDIIDEGWGLMIAHPPCTYLCNSGVRWLYKREGRWELMKEAIDFFHKLLSADIPHICVENPIMHGYARQLLRKKSILGATEPQIIQPWMFGHAEQKATCLWLKALPKLKSTDDVKTEMMKLPNKERQRIWYGKGGVRERSRSFLGISEAMANQWSTLPEKKGLLI